MIIRLPEEGTTGLPPPYPLSPSSPMSPPTPPHYSQNNDDIRGQYI